MSLAEVIAERENFKKFNKLFYYSPYLFQKAFHHARSKECYESGDYELREGKIARTRGMMAANKVGKTLAAAYELAMHLTGEYPDWWEGHRFDRAVKCCVAGVNNDKTKDICQGEMFGDPEISEEFGTGTVPKHLIIDSFRKPGVVNAYQSVLVRHKSGGVSKVFFGAYAQDKASFFGSGYDICWEDEEPPMDVHSQCIRSILATKGILMVTFTPEEGQTELVYQFLEDLKNGQSLVKATWDDAPHFNDPEFKAEIIEQIPVHELDMRSKGIPLMGSGMVFQVSESEIRTPRREILRHWPRLCAVDFGMDHPFAAIWLAWDRDRDIVYIYDVYKKRRVEIDGPLIAAHSSAIKKRGSWIPVVWPHDMEQEDPKSCTTYADMFREEQVNMMGSKFTNPPASGQKEGEGGIGVEVGIQHILERMQIGTFKVFDDLEDWFVEFRGYHRKDGKLVKIRDDVMAATRYGIQSLRHAYTQPIMHVRTNQRVGATNW